MEIKEGPCLAAMSCGKPAYLVVLLDHPGAAGARLIDIAINWQPAMLKADFLLAEAPLPGKAPGSRQWFETEGKSPDEILAGMKEAAEGLNKFLDEELEKRRRMDSHLALVGFGQGADLALYAGLRRPKPMGSLVAFAGKLRSPELLATEITSRPDMLLVHGDADPVVPYETMTQTKEALKAFDVPVKSMTCKGAGHLVSDDGVMGCEAFLLKTLLKPKPKVDPADYDVHDHGHDDHDHDHSHDDHGHDNHDHAHDDHDHAH